MNMRYINKLLFFILLLCISSNVYACTMSEEYKRWLELSEEERSNYIEPVYCKEALSVSKNPFVCESPLGASIYDSSYKVRFSSPVRNQRNTNTCWAFALMAQLEASARMLGFGNFDFSERHLAYSTSKYSMVDYTPEDGYNLNVIDGGTYNMASSYLYNAMGPVSEADVPFLNNNQQTTKLEILDKKVSFLVDDYYYAYYKSGSCSNTQINKIKDGVIRYAGVGVSMYFDVDYMKSNFYYNYNPTSGNVKDSNHAVVVVGWDDTISKNNFPNATRNGAFIVRNSWGAGPSDDGYFYVSYDDFVICDEMHVYTGLSDNKYTKVEKSSYSISNGLTIDSFKKDDGSYETVYMSKFNYPEKQFISRISFEAPANVNYKVYYAAGDAEANRSNWRLLREGSTSDQGVYSIKFNDMEVQGKISFITYFYSANSFSVPIFCSSSLTSSHYYNISVKKNSNYYLDGSVWEDLSNIKPENYTFGCSNGIFVYSSSEKTMKSGVIALGSASGYLRKASTTDKVVFDVNASGELLNSRKLLYVLSPTGEVVTDKLNVNASYSTGKITITPKVTTLDKGKYTVVIESEYVKAVSTFEVKEDIIIKNYKVSGSDIIINIPAKLAVSYSEFITNISNLSGFYVTNTAGSKITSGNVGTGYSLTNGTVKYNIILKGDVNRDAKISALDYIAIKNHIMDSAKVKDAKALIAADVNSDNKIGALDYIAIKNAIMK